MPAEKEGVPMNESLPQVPGAYSRPVTAQAYILLTPGPTPLPPSVSAKMAEPILHHRTKEFGKVFDQVINDMKYVYRTHHIHTQKVP